MNGLVRCQQAVSILLHPDRRKRATVLAAIKAGLET
jgi:hypothetical protein